MKHLKILMKKEWMQIIRDYKIVWLPLVFISLGITQPLVTYYLPSILGSMGSDQGITIDPNIMDQNGGEVLASTLASQFDQLGLVVVILATMGIIQADKARDLLPLIFTRPVTTWSYIGAKVISHYLLISGSLAIGFLFSYFYVNSLFSIVAAEKMIIALLCYLVWMLFIVSFILMVSTIFHHQGMIALISIIFLLGSRMIVGLNPVIDVINPGSMSAQAAAILTAGSMQQESVPAFIASIFWIIITLLISNHWIKNKKYHMA